MGGGGAMNGAVDWAVVGAGIRTLDPARPHASALAVHDGVVVAVGTDDEIRARCDTGTPVLDGAGLAFVPGLVDSHQHPIWGAALTDGVDLGGLETLDQV